jgi:hypothetical protein
MVNLPALAEIFRPAGPSIAKIEATLNAIDTELAAAHDAYSVACLDVEAGDGDALQTKQQVERERARLAQRREDLLAALGKAQDRDQRNVEAEAAAEKARAWAALKAANAARWSAAERMDKAADEFAAAYKNLLSANAALYQAIPGEFRGKADHDAGMVRIQALEEAVRLDLLKRDVTWSISYPWKHTIIPFLAKLEDATKVISSWLPQA